jgi:hypothetical protein
MGTCIVGDITINTAVMAYHPTSFLRAAQYWSGTYKFIGNLPFVYTRCRIEEAAHHLTIGNPWRQEDSCAERERPGYSVGKRER